MARARTTLRRGRTERKAQRRRSMQTLKMGTERNRVRKNTARTRRRCRKCKVHGTRRMHVRGGKRSETARYAKEKYSTVAAGSSGQLLGEGIFQKWCYSGFGWLKRFYQLFFYHNPTTHTGAKIPKLFLFYSEKNFDQKDVFGEKTKCGFRNLSLLDVPEWDQNNTKVNYRLKSEDKLNADRGQKSIEFQFDNKDEANKFKGYLSEFSVRRAQVVGSASAPTPAPAPAHPAPQSGTSQ